MSQTGSKQSFWDSTAAVLSAVAALITALAGVAILLVDVFRGADPAAPGTSDAAPPSSPVGPAADDAVPWQGTLVLSPLQAVDWDVAPPQPDSSTRADTYIWNNAEISSPSGMVRWTGTREPLRADCADLVATHAVDERLELDTGDRYCVGTGEGRIVAVTVLGRESGSWEVAAIVWGARTG